jgi:hypothetical protein
MSFELSSTAVIKQVAGSLVATRQYASVEEALWELALSAIRTKVAYYRRRVRKLENKYGVDFDTFTNRLQEQATPGEEDDWLAWRSARAMLADWQKAYHDLRHEHPH